MAVSVVNCGIVSEIAESAAYSLLRQSTIESGKSEQYADCIQKVLKWQDPAKDFKENIFTPDRFLQHLKSELQTADFLCENRIALSVGAIVIVILFLMCCVCQICR